MATPKETQSRVPPHLRQFLRSSVATAPLQTEAPYSYTLPSAQCLSPVELNPPHWRLAKKKSLRSRLKDLVLKTPPDGLHEQTPKDVSSQHRPTMMRMKDSDDYITARAANPRTGLISPSIGSPSPRTPCTPSTPGDALELPKRPAPSPTPDARSRPALSRANEGRQVSAGSLNRWRADAKGWVSETALSAASPRETAMTVGAGLSMATSQAMLKDDQFVVHMPSAREPQPYIYPGRTAGEIEAFEHYKRKARRINGDGYGERRVSGSGNSKTLGGVRKRSASNAHAYDRAAPSTMTATVDPYCHNRAEVVLPAINVAKRPGRGYGITQELPSMAGAEVSASTFAPFSSPRTPASRPAAEDTELKTVRVPGAFRELSPEHLPTTSSIPRKPVHMAPNDAVHAYQTDSSPELVGASRLTDLSQLPRVRLVHPELASLPQSHALRHLRDGARTCSLGCQREEDTGQCLESRKALCERAVKPHLSLFGTNQGGSTWRNGEVVEILVGLVASAVDFSRHLHLPKVGLLEALRAPEATPQHKVDAMKALLALTGQGLALLMVVTVLWRLGAALMHVSEVLFWPLAVLVKILRWLAGYA
ncbi:hypothetical protein LTR85_004922 [Meristemomyces frigidus]|nr:hypothetical protein LTR85_004922 [Meristemomyces frigidus]